MVELSLRERLQPALLDRLSDDERFLTIFQIGARREELARLKLAVRELLDILSAQGLRPMTEEEAPQPQGAAELLTWNLYAAAGRVSLTHIKSLVLRPPGAPAGIAVQEFCQIETRNVPNALIESAEHRVVSMRRLREYVLRDVSALLNSLNLEMNVDLARYPRVQRSVLNYGLHSLAGRSATAVDPVKIAADIEESIRRFEPRLRRVRVSPESADGSVSDNHQLAFRIDAELWGQPIPQQLVLRTRIETDTGHATVGDGGAG